MAAISFYDMLSTCANKVSVRGFVKVSKALHTSARSLNAAIANNTAPEVSQQESKIHQGVWSKFENRSEDLKIKNPVLRDEILNGVDPKRGPLTLKRPINKIGYESPIGLNEVFPLAYNFLQEHAGKVYEEVSRLEEVIANTKDEQQLKELKDKKKKLIVEAEKYNPEVLYKVQFANPENLNLKESVFQHYYKTKNFEGYNKMLLMQRIEQLKIIPDSIPTINPSVELDVKFVNESGINRSVIPGDILSSKTTSKPPTFQVKSFEEIDPTENHALLIVNLDQPNLKTNSFSTTLNYGLQNLKLQSNNQIIGFEQLSNSEFSDYVPPVPEKNAPTSRFAVLLFKQPKEIKDLSSYKLIDFDLRKFVSENNLTPIGINCWRSAWDSNVKNVRELYGLPKGKVYHRVRR